MQNELNDWSNRFVAKLQSLPELEDVATDQQTGGLAVSLVIDRVTASRLGIAPSTIDNTLYDAFGQRQINTMYTQLNQYHVILETQPQFQHDPNTLQQPLYSGQRFLRNLRRPEPRPLSPPLVRPPPDRTPPQPRCSIRPAPLPAFLTPPSNALSPSSIASASNSSSQHTTSKQCRSIERIYSLRAHY